LPATGTVLEIASGTGQHAIHFAAALPHLVWQPSDLDDEARASIAAWTAHSGLANVRPPLALDVRDASWGIEAAAAIVCINMIHISPWASAQALIGGAGRLLGAGGVLVLYGPYRRGGAHTAPTNAAFDEQLQRRNPAWGVRDMEDVVALADAAGFDADEPVEMPANNFSLVFRKR
jgi:SAM-dependent methyltransferase